MLNLFDPRRAAATPGDQERLDWLRLSRTENVGPVTFARLMDLYGTPTEALKNLPDLAKRGGRKTPLRPPPEGEIQKEYAALKQMGGQILTWADEAYPALLRNADDSPPVIACLGNTGLLLKSCIAIVGARNASLNGKKFAGKLAADLGAKGQVVVSGLARGIDTAAHEGSLKTGTIAVVAGGIDVVYPPENATLYERIKEQGLIIAESPLGAQPLAQHFPRRNRIVSGLSRGVVVVEATLRSGSLITARLAGEQGRELWAVPGHPLDPRAEGPNHLIREGAGLVRSADDILENLLHFDGGGLRDFCTVQSPIAMPLEKPEDLPEGAEDILLSQLSFAPCSVDELIRTTAFSTAHVQTLLLELELAGRIKRLPGGRVSLCD